MTCETDFTCVAAVGNSPFVNVWTGLDWVADREKPQCISDRCSAMGAMDAGLHQH